MTASGSQLSSWIMAVNESGFLEDWKSILQLPLVKKSLFLFGKQKQKHPRPSPLQWGRWLPLQWALYFPSRRVLHPDLICPITPSAHELLRPLQHTHRVFEDGLYWVREQKMLNYLYKWQGRNTLFPFGSRMYYMTSLYCSLISSFCFVYSNFKMTFHFLQQQCQR